MNIRVTPAPPHKPSRMPTEHRLLLRALQGLREGEAIRLYCNDPEDVTPTARTIRSFIHRVTKGDRLSGSFSVVKREEEESWVIYVIKLEPPRGNDKNERL